MSIGQQTATGIKWQVSAAFLHRIISFGTTIILARILGPSNYGLFAFSLTVIGAFGLFKSLGIESALIQRKDETLKAANTAFFIIPTLGFALYLLLYVTAPFIASFLNNKELCGVLRVLGVVFVLWSFSRVPLSILEKGMKFAAISIAEVSGALLFSIVAIVLAKSGGGVWSLVYGYLINTLIFTLMIWLFCKWMPDFTFNRTIALELFHFGKFIFLGAALLFLKMNLDNMLVGRILGFAKLGLYAVAFNISNFISDYFGNKVYRVTYPAYAKLQNDSGALRSAYLKVIKHIALIATPFCFGILILGGQFLRVAYGEKWLGASGVMKMLAFAGLFNAITTSNEAILLAQGKSKITFWIYFIQVALFLIFIKPAAHLFGLYGVGIVVGGASFLAMLFSFYQVSQGLSLNFKLVYLSFRPSLASSLFMGVILMAAQGLLAMSGISKFVTFHISFISLFAIAISGYVLFIYKIDATLLRDIKKITFS